MTKPRVYVETTIPSFYYELRTAPEIVARRDWTRRWWDIAADRYELVTSEAALDELASGISERSSERLTLVQDLPLLPVVPAIVAIVQTYLQHNVKDSNVKDSMRRAPRASTGPSAGN